MVIKEHINKFEKNKKPWARVVKWILGILGTLFLIGFILTQQPDPKPPVELPKYEVKVGNSIGHHAYHCESYTLEGSTYKLFNEENTLTNEMTITDGYVVEVKLTD